MYATDGTNAETRYNLSKRDVNRRNKWRSTSREGVAQLVEQRTFNPLVLGSSPSTLTFLSQGWFSSNSHRLICGKRSFEAVGPEAILSSPNSEDGLTFYLSRIC